MERLPKPEGTRGADVLIDGRAAEFKKLEPGATSSTVKNRVSDSISGPGQARDIYFDARGSGLSAGEAERALDRIGGIHRGKVDQVTIVGDGFEVTRGYP